MIRKKSVHTLHDERKAFPTQLPYGLLFRRHAWGRDRIMEGGWLLHYSGLREKWSVVRYTLYAIPMCYFARDRVTTP